MKKTHVEPPATAPQDDSDFLTIRDAAALVHVSEATLRRKLTLRQLNRYKFFSRTLLRRSELIAKIRQVPQ